VQLQSKLDLLLQYHCGRNNARSPGASSYEGIRPRKHSMVEGVEKFGSELQTDLFCQIEDFSRQ
jgi:hypothetical protein